MAQKPRVVITGLGVVAPNGVGKNAFWNGLQQGRSGIRHITLFDTSNFPCHIGGEIDDFQPASYIKKQDVKRLSRVSQFAVAAAQMALHDSALQMTAENAHRTGVCFGTSAGKGEIFETDHLAFLERGTRGIHPLSFIEFLPHGVSSHVAIELGIGGISGSVASGCTSGLDAVYWGYTQICLRRATVMVVGSAEALLNPFSFGAVCASGALSKRHDPPETASRPFDLHRDGIVLSEGAGAIILETLEQAQERNATIYAEVLGFATAREGADLVRCDLSGSDMARVMEAALYHASLPKELIDYINAHGVGLPDYDTAETSAIKSVFGNKAYNMAVSSIKSMIGQPFAAGGSLQIVSSCMTLQHGVIPPTINYDTPDPDCDLDYVPNQARKARVRTLLVHAHGIGGTDSALVLGKLDCMRDR